MRLAKWSYLRLRWPRNCLRCRQMITPKSKEKRRERSQVFSRRVKFLLRRSRKSPLIVIPHSLPPSLILMSNDSLPTAPHSAYLPCLLWRRVHLAHPLITVKTSLNGRRGRQPPINALFFPKPTTKTTTDFLLVGGFKLFCHFEFSSHCLG